MISRNYAWIDETIEHSEQDATRATVLAKKWSQLMTSEENRRFDRLAHEEYDYNECECDYCLIANHSCNTEIDEACSLCQATTELTECERDTVIRERQAERDLEIELIEDKLAAIGARMMRPYEHWNEDERYMEYMENRGY